MADYRLTEDSSVIRTADGARIPSDEGNRDWMAYVEWLNAGNTPDPVPVKIPPPVTEITRRQLILTMMSLQLITPDEAVAAAMGTAIPALLNTYFEAISDPAARAAAKITWAAMSVCTRDNEMFNAIALSQGFTSTQIDTLFTQASTL